MTVHTPLPAIALLGILAAVAGCGGDAVAPSGGGPPPPVDVSWSRLQGGIGIDTLRAASAVSPGTFFVVHSRGVLRVENGGWKEEKQPSLAGPLWGIWGTSPSRMFAVGRGGTILRRDGSGWTNMAAPKSVDLADVSGTATSAFAVGSEAPGSGCALRLSGGAWSVMKDGFAAALNAVWAATDHNVFVAGEGGFISHYDGAGWTPMATGVGDDLFDLWGSSPSNVYAVGAGGRILRYDGSAWSDVSLGTSETFHGVWGSSANDVRVVGSSGAIRWDGSSWSRSLTGVTSTLFSISGVSAAEAFAVGADGTVLGIYGQTWVRLLHALPYTIESLWSPGLGFIAAGGDGASGVVTDGLSTWTFPTPLHGVTSFGGPSYYAVGDAGTIVHFDGDVWLSDPSPSSESLRAITGLKTRFGDPYRLYAVGDNGTILVWRGAQFTQAVPPVGAEAFDFVDVWAAALDDIFAVASNSSAIVRYDDPLELAGWTIEDTPARGALFGVGGFELDTYAVSDLGEILHHDGSKWELMTSPVTAPLRDVRGISGGSVYAVGDGGVVLHYDGYRWYRTPIPFVGDLAAVFGRSGAVYVGGVQGAVYEHRD